MLQNHISSPIVMKLRAFFEFKFSMRYVFKNKTKGPNRIGCIYICFQKILLNLFSFGFVLILDIFFSQISGFKLCDPKNFLLANILYLQL